MRENARLVIIGAGIVGCSAAYHLTRLVRYRGARAGTAL